MIPYIKEKFKNGLYRTSIFLFDKEIEELDFTQIMIVNIVYGSIIGVVVIILFNLIF